MDIKKYISGAFLLFLMIANKCSSQQIKPSELFGKWKVQDWLFFEKFKETPNEHSERMKEYKKCLKAKFKINSTGIKIAGDNYCNFDFCDNDFENNPKYFEKKVINDNAYTLKEQGSEMVDSNIVGKKFVHLLDKKYSKSTLTLIDAGCTQSYGNFTMKICIVNKNKIGLFMGEEMIILVRDGKK